MYSVRVPFAFAQPNILFVCLFVFFGCFQFYNSSIKFIRKLKCLITSEQIFITIFFIMKYNEITFEKKIS